MWRYVRNANVARRGRLAPALAAAAVFLVVLGRWTVSAPRPSAWQRHRGASVGAAPAVELQWHGIEKRIHQTWKSAELPADVAPMAASWLEKNPGYEYTLYTDEDIEAYMPEASAGGGRAGGVCVGGVLPETAPKPRLNRPSGPALAPHAAMLRL